MNKKTVVVFSHAHWDIEWYMPFRSFRFWLLDIMDMLKEIDSEVPGFGPYVLDGQVAPLDHYLEVRPEDAAWVREMVRSGKLAIGPFYTQFDEWLVSAESIVRNCLHGIRRGREYGPVMTAGYLPDNFGHPLQLPQILLGFGIDSLVFMRGMVDRPEDLSDEFLLQGLDGSKVLAIHLNRGYGNAVNIWRQKAAPMTVRTTPYHEQFIGLEYEAERVRNLDVAKAAEELVASARQELASHPSGVAPLAFGCDHCPPAAKMPAIIELANRMQDEIEFVQGDVADLVSRTKAERRQFPTFAKELWGGKYHLILNGTLATRSYIKQSNYAAENLLEVYAEPLACMAAVHGKSYPRTMFDEAWRMMYHNHAHDSIHGSSVDPVHLEMMQRYAAVRQTAVGIIHYSLKHLAQRMAPWWQRHPAGILAYAPLPPAQGTYVGDVWVESQSEDFHLEDAGGNPLPVQILDNPLNDVASGNRSNCDAWPSRSARHILFQASGISQGLATFALVPGRLETPTAANHDACIENEFLKVSVRDGLLDILDKPTGTTHRGLNLIEEEADAGDAWDFSVPLEPARTYRNNEFPATARLVENGPVRSTIRIETRMRVPARMIGNKRSRQKTDLVLVADVSLLAGARRVEVALEFDNQAKDHRLRLRCPTAIQTDQIVSQGHFGIIRRPVTYPYDTKDWVQAPSTYHFRDFVAVADQANGLAVACRGLHEYEPMETGTGVALLVTLLRGIERMSKWNTKARGRRDGSPSHAMPEAQCLGRQRFEYAFVPFAAGEGFAFLDTVRAFLYPPVCHLIRDEQRPELPVEPAMFHLEPANVVFSCLKAAEDGNGYILRFFENEGKDTCCTVKLARVFRRASLTNLNEDPIGDIPIREGTIRLELAANKIATIRLVP